MDCDKKRLRCLPQGMDKLTNLKLLNLSATVVIGSPSFDKLSSLQNLTYLFIKVHSLSIINRVRDHTWISRLKRFCIEVGEGQTESELNKSTRMISVSNSEIFCKGELSGMLQFASHFWTWYPAKV